MDGLSRIKEELSGEDRALVVWIEPYIKNWDEIHNFHEKHRGEIRKEYNSRARLDTVLGNVQETMKHISEVSPWHSSDLIQGAKSQVSQVLKKEGELSLDEIFFLLLKLNPNPVNSAPSELYEDYMKRLLRLPQVDEAFLVFLCKLSPEDLVSFWVRDEAFKVLEEKGWDRHMKNRASRLEGLPYTKHEKWYHITHRKILYQIMHDRWVESKI